MGKNWWQKALLALYPFAMGFSLLYGGEHYVVDEIAGRYALAVVGAWLSTRPASPSYRDWSLRPPGSWRPSGTSAAAGSRRRPVVGLDREHLVQLDLVALEAEPRAGHVEAPDPRRALADLGDAGVPVVARGWGTSRRSVRA